MTTLQVSTFIKAPPVVCFDLARDIGFHCQSAGKTQEKAVAGVTSGLIGPGEWVTFEGVHFGVRQRLTACVTEFQREATEGQPLRFVDETTKSVFVSMRHVHEFVPYRGGTLMRDTLLWKSPLGVLGVCADLILVRRHLRRFLRERNRILKQEAEERGRVAEISLSPQHH